MNYEQNKNEFSEKVFFKTHTENLFFEQFDNDVVLYGGIDPWDTIKDNKFDFLFGSSTILDYLLPIVF